MSNNSDFGDIIRDLIGKAASFQRVGDIYRARDLMDEAIAFSESRGDPSFLIKLHREIMITSDSPDFPKNNPAIKRIMEQAFAYYRSSGRILEQIDMLINLSAVTTDSAHALLYLDEAAETIATITETQIAEISKQLHFKNISVSKLLSNRSSYIKYRKNQILS